MLPFVAVLGLLVCSGVIALLASSFSLWTWIAP